MPIFIELDSLPSHVDARYQGRIRIVERASIELSDIRVRDEGWYECSIIFIKKVDDLNPNGTWVYLAVTGEQLRLFGVYLAVMHSRGYNKIVTTTPCRILRILSFCFLCSNEDCYSLGLCAQCA